MTGRKQKLWKLSYVTMGLLAGAGLTGSVCPVQAADSGDEWAIYWYLCGSDLESEGGCATEDISELLDVELPDNVKVVIETGGSSQWQNEVVEADYLERYVYSSDGFECGDQQPLANMGESETLADFLTFCEENYPAEHTAVIFWNHGGGSVQGVAFDENYGYDSLTLAELREAFDSVYDLSEEDPPLELVGFDACLMATVDTANAFSDIARYMVASEETEPGNGWYYTGWAEVLAENPYMDGAELGTAICDSYVEGCELYGTEDEITLSVVDLGQIAPLLSAYDDLGKEILSATCEDASFYTEFGRNAELAENYGGNTRDTGYTNMVDLKDLTEMNSYLLTDTVQDVLDGLENCVGYKVNGPYRQKAGGLSCYYSYNGDAAELEDYAWVGSSETFQYLYEYAVSGNLSEDAEAYIEDLGYEEWQGIFTLADEPEEAEYPVYINE